MDGVSSGQAYCETFRLQSKERQSQLCILSEVELSISLAVSVTGLP